MDKEGSGSEWEVRPGGMLVQRRDPDFEPDAGPLISIRVFHDLLLHHLSVPSKITTFGDLKKLLMKETGLQPIEQRLIYRGKERDNNAYLHEAGVKNKSKIKLVEDHAMREKILIETRRDAENARASKAVADVKEEADKLVEQVVKIEGSVRNGIKVPENEIVVLVEKLMCQLLKLDAVISNGDLKLQRRGQVRRLQKYIETLDALKDQNAQMKVRNVASKPRNLDLKPIPKQSQLTGTALKWRSTEGGSGSSAQTTAIPPNPSTPVPNLMNWELFD